MRLKKITYKAWNGTKSSIFTECKKGLREIKIIGEFMEFDKDKVIEEKEVFFDEMIGDFKEVE